jgi:hypothetical protein
MNCTACCGKNNGDVQLFVENAGTVIGAGVYKHAFWALAVQASRIYYYYYYYYYYLL